MKLRIFCTALLSLCCGTCLLALDHTKDSLETVKKNLADKKAVLLDVREIREWNQGHLKDAQLQPLSALNKAAEDPAAKQKLQQQLPKDRIIYCHCARGVRAQMAGDILHKMGYDVRPLAAGFDELRQQGFEAASAENGQ